MLFTCITFPLSIDRYNSLSFSLVRLVMLSFMFVSFKACSSLAFISFSLRSDHRKKATILEVLVLCNT